VTAAGDAEEVVLEIAGREVVITRPDKVFFAKRGETKLDLVRYYEAVAGPLIATMGGRPTLLQRFPDGAGGPNFFQKRVPATAPRWLETTTVSTVNGTPSTVMVPIDVAHVAWAVNIGCLGFHVWPTRAGAASEGDPDPAAPSAGYRLAPLERGPLADELRIDLDAPPDVDFAMVREGAHEVHALLGELGVQAWVKTTGRRGLHVYAHVEGGRWSSYDVRAAAVAVARELERRRPDLLTAAWWKEERGRRVFVDFNQNAPHKTVFGAWSVRARPGAQVSTPFAWEELETIEPDPLTIDTVPARLAERGDPWAGMYDAPQPLEPLLDLYRAQRGSGLLDAPWPPVYPKMPDEPPRVAPSRARGSAAS
jgi:DNA ligase D-like protein (predicted polymerase)